MSDNLITDYDPDAFRMTLGEHLEELRRRLILALLGFGAALGFCFFYGKEMLSIFCKPMIDVLLEYDVNPSFFTANVSDGFMVFMQVSMISAIVISSPWIVWQFWQFIAAGLYQNERKTVTRYVPLSIGLLITGFCFVYFLVLPWTLEFFMAFTISIPMPQSANVIAPTTGPAVMLPVLPQLAGDPPSPPDGAMWFDTLQQRPKLMVKGAIRVLQFGPENLVAPHILLPDYVDLAMGMLLVFGLSFQLPIVIMALARLGIIQPENLRGARRIVYFGMAVVSAVITPGDVITATVALMIPLCLLFELGIFLAARGPKSDLLDGRGFDVEPK